MMADNGDARGSNTQVGDSWQEVARRRIVWVLRLTIAIQAIGIAGQFYFGEFETESPLFSYLLYERQWDEQAAQRLDDAGTMLWLAAGLVVVALPLIASFVGRESAATANERKRSSSRSSTDGAAP